MDETPEQMDQIRREADAIDPYRYRSRKRIMMAIALGALLAGLTYVIFEAVDLARNPCERVRDYHCGKDAKSLNCSNYEGMFRESVDDPSTMARQAIRHQCETHIKRQKLDQGVTIP